MALPNHGPIECNCCFSGEFHQPHYAWTMRKDPCTWGASDPEILVLGFSKGATQTNIMASGNFNDIAFGGPMRSRLDRLAKRLRLLGEDGNISDEISNPLSRFAFGSLVRCSLTRTDNKGVQRCSGNLIVRSFKEIPHILDTCARAYLSRLTKTTKLVIMLGCSDNYINGCFNLFSHLNSDVKRVNAVAYSDGVRLFVHVAHPSPANGHFESWCAGGEKFELALSALANR